MNGDSGKPYTGAILFRAYAAALRDARDGVDGATEAVDAFAQDVDRVSMRDDEYGLAARKARSGLSQFMSEAVAGRVSDPDSYLDMAGDSMQTLSGYLVDDGSYEDTRRFDLLGVDRKPSYRGEDGRLYVDAAGTPQEIPVEKYLPYKEQLAEAWRGEMPLFGQLTGPNAMPVLVKAADFASRAIDMATSGRSWDEIPPSVDVPTADPAMPFPVMPRIADNQYEAFALLQDPVELRAMQEVMAQASQEGLLELSGFDHFLATAGFLIDFAVTTKGLGAVGSRVGAAAGKLTGPVGRLARATAIAAEEQTAVQGGLAATRPAIRQGFSTVRDFVGYHVVQDSLYGRIDSPQDVVASGLAGAKEGAIMVGAGLAMSAARTSLMRALASKSVDPVTNTLGYRFGPLGRAVGSVYEAARADASVDQLVAKMSKLAGGGKSLRETLVRSGWPQTRAQMAEHMIDSAALGFMFGAYHNAVADPEWDNLEPFGKAARMVQGLTSPEAVGSAAAFSGSVVAHAYAHKLEWGREWENAPPELRRKLELDVQAIVRELAQPSNHELVDGFRKAFDAYREKNPKDFEGVEFEAPWIRDLKLSTAEALAENRAEALNPEGPKNTGEQPPPPEGPAPTAPESPQNGPSSGPSPATGPVPEVQPRTSPEAPNHAQSVAFEKAYEEGNLAEAQRILDELPDPRSRGPYTFSDANSIAVRFESDRRIKHMTVRGQPLWQWVEAVRREVSKAPPLVPLAPGVSERGENALFGPQAKAPRAPQEGASQSVVQPNLLDVNSRDVRGQGSIIDASESAPERDVLELMKPSGDWSPTPRKAQQAPQPKVQPKRRTKSEVAREKHSRLIASALGGELGFRSWLRAMGGLNISKSADVAGEVRGFRESYNERKFGLGPLVHREKSGKGMSLDAALEAAMEEGHLPQGSGLKDLIDLIHSDHTLAGAAAHASREQAAEAARYWELSPQERADFERRAREQAEVDAQALREGWTGEETQGDPEFTIFQTAPGFIPFPEKPVRPMSPEASKTWLGTIQNMLFPLTEFRSERARAMVKAVVSVFGLPVEQAEAAVQLMEAHADVWSKSHGKDAADWYKERLAGLTKNQPPLGSPAGARAATTFLADGRAVLHALEQPTIASLMHELGHVWRRDLQGSAKSTVESWLNVKDGNWTVRAEEKFANAFERYMRTGKAPTEGLRAAFGSMRTWMRGLYHRIRGTGLDVHMDGDVRRAMDSLFTLPKLNEDAVVQERLSKLTDRDRGAIYARNRNKPQYVGLALQEIVAHELRGGLPSIEATPAIKVAQAGDSIREAAEILRLHGALDHAAPFESPAVARAMIELAKGGDAYKGRFETMNAAPALAQAVEAAKRAKTQMREVANSITEQKQRDQLGLLFEYQDAAQGSEIPADLAARMKSAGMMDANGRVNRQTAAALGQRLETELAIRSIQGAKDRRLIQPSAAARPWIALNVSPWEFKEHALARSLKLQRGVDFLAKHGAFPPSLLKRLQKIGVVTGGLWKTNFNGSEVNATIKSAAMHVFRNWETATQVLTGRGDDAIARIMARFGGRVPPRSHMTLLNKVIESGELQRMRGPHDFEKYKQGTGYLFEIARDINDILTQLGQLGVQAQFLAPEQIEKWGGRYRPHLYLERTEEESVRELREGRLPWSQARSLARREGPEQEAQIQITDPFQWLTAVTRQEGKTAQYLGTIADLVNGGYAITREQFEKLDPYTQTSYEPIALNPKSHAPGLGNGPALRNFVVLGDMLAKQLDPNHAAPKSAELQRTLTRLLGVDANGQPIKDGAMLVPRQVLWELDALTGQLFNPPDLQGWLSRRVYDYEQSTRAFRRGLTIGRPKHWTLNIVNSVGTGHALDRLPAWDVMRSVTTGQGYFADSVRQLMDLLELTQRGSPTEKPQDWTVERWEAVKLLEEGFKELNGTTFTGVGLEASVVTDALSSLITPDMKTASLLAELDSMGLSPEAASTQRGVILDASRRWSGGMVEFDRRLQTMIGSHDAAERARGIANFTALYQIWEMSFKWAATLRTLDQQPVGMSLKQAVRYAAVGTADYMNTSPLVRSFNTSYSTFSNPLYAKTEGGARWGRAVMREALKGRFWMYQSTMTPPLLASVAAHPLKAATVLAMTAGVTGLINSMAANDPEEDASFQEALRGSLARQGSALFDDATLEIASRAIGGAPNVSGGGSVPDNARGAMGGLWLQLLRGKSLMFQAPSRGDETRISSFEDVAPGWGNWIGLANGAQNFMQSTTADKVAALIDSMSLRGMELSIAAAHGMFGLADVLSADGPEAYLEATKSLRGAASDIVPTLSPLWPISRDGQRLVEVAALNGQNFDEWARGVIQVDQPQPGQNVGEALFSTFWRSQRLMQPQMGGVSEREALDAMLGRLMPESNPSRGPYWDKLRQAQSDVHYQISETLAGTYQEYTAWGRNVMTFDAMLAPAMFQQDGPMQTMIAREPDPEKRGMMQRYLQRFATGEEWRRSLGAMMEIANRREMRPDFFRQAISSAMRDPTGTALLNWIDKETSGKIDPEKMPDLAAAFLRGVQQPPAGNSERYRQWSRVLARFYEAGLSSSFMPDNAADALRRLKIKPELAGMPALQQAITTRQ